MGHPSFATGREIGIGHGDRVGIRYQYREAFVTGRQRRNLSELAIARTLTRRLALGRVPHGRARRQEYCSGYCAPGVKTAPRTWASSSLPCAVRAGIRADREK